MPKVTLFSVHVGEYSYISPSTPGTNPGMTSPIPFSMKTPIITRTHPMFRVRKFSLARGLRNMRNAVMLKSSAAHIHGTRVVLPLRPK